MSVCDGHVEWEMIALSLYFIYAIIQIYVSVSALNKIIQINKEQKLSLLSLISQWIFFISSMIFCISRITSTVLYCFASNYHYISFIIAFISYMCHILGLLLLLYSRLRDVFKNSIYSISKCSEYVFMIIIILMLSYGLYLLIGPNNQNINGFLARMAEVFVLVLIVCQFLAWSFVYKLFKLHTSTEIQDPDFLRFLRKYAVLNIICVMFTTLFAIISTIAALNGSNYIWVQILSLILVGDVFTDTVCMLLSLKGYDNHYARFCFICHNHCPFLICIKQKDNAIQLERVITVGSNSPTSDNQLSPTESPKSYKL